MDEKLFSDEIRERERKRRRKDLLWSVVSFVLHVVLFGAIVMLTPVKSLVFDKEKKKANPAADLPAEMRAPRPVTGSRSSTPRWRSRISSKRWRSSTQRRQAFL